MSGIANALQDWLSSGQIGAKRGAELGHAFFRESRSFWSSPGQTNDIIAFMTEAVTRLIEQVRALSPNEQRELRRWMNHGAEAMAGDLFGQKLIDLGIGHPRAAGSCNPNPEPIDLPGRPLSEQLIEERR